MTHIAPRSAEDASLFVRFAYHMARRRVGRVPAPMGVMAHHSTILAASGAFELGLERAHRADERLKYLAELRVASLVGCRFCIDIGSSLASKAGLSRDELLALPRFEDSDAFSDLDRRVLTLATQMTETPSRPDAELVLGLEEELGTEALVELCAAIAWENFRARFNHAVGAEAEGYSDEVVCALPTSDHGIPSESDVG